MGIGLRGCGKDRCVSENLVWLHAHSLAVHRQPPHCCRQRIADQLLSRPGGCAESQTDRLAAYAQGNFSRSGIVWRSEISCSLGVVLQASCSPMPAASFIARNSNKATALLHSESWEL